MPSLLPRIRTWLASTQSRILILLLLAVAPAFALILFSAYEERQQAVAESQRQVQVLSQEIHSRMQELLEHSHGMLQNLGRTPEVRAETAADRCTRLLADLLQMHDQYEDISIADSFGRVRCSNRPLRAPVDLSAREYFKTALKLRSFTIGDYQLSPITGKGTIPLAEPLIGPQGNISALVSLDIDLSWLHRMLLRTNLPNGSILTLLDSHGQVLAGYPSEAAQIGHSDIEWEQFRDMLQASASDVSETTSSDGVDRWTLLTPLVPPGYGGNLYLWIGVPSKMSYSEIDWAVKRNLSLMAVAAVLVLALGRLFASRLLLRRVGDLSQTARRLSSGDMTARTLLPADESELGQLSTAFNQMGETLAWREARIKESDEELRRANRALGVLSAVNRSLIRAGDEQALLHNVCREIVEIGHYPLAWVGYADSGEGKRIRTMAKAGNDQGYVDALDLTWDDQPSGSGPTGTAIRTKQSVIVRHVLSDPQFVRWRDAALRQGFASTVSLPLIVNRAAIGALRIYAPEADAFDEKEMKLL